MCNVSSSRVWVCIGGSSPARTRHSTIAQWPPDWSPASGANLQQGRTPEQVYCPGGTGTRVSPIAVRGACFPARAVAAVAADSVAAKDEEHPRGQGPPVLPVCIGRAWALCQPRRVPFSRPPLSQSPAGSGRLGIVRAAPRASNGTATVLELPPIGSAHTPPSCLCTGCHGSGQAALLLVVRSDRRRGVARDDCSHCQRGSAG